jgi:hypothetical protein
MFILRSLPLVSFQIGRVKCFMGMPLSFDVLELDHPRPRRPVQRLLGLSPNQVQPSCVQELAKGLIVESGISNNLLDVADGGRSDRVGYRGSIL